MKSDVRGCLWGLYKKVGCGEGQLGRVSRLKELASSRGLQADGWVWLELRHHWAGMCWLLAQAKSWPELLCL